MYISMKIKKAPTIVSLVICAAILTFIFGHEAIAVKATEVFSDEEKVTVPILMYHSILKDSSMWGKYVISPDMLEADVKQLSEKGYTSVFVNDLIKYVNGKGTLPKKPVILSFDDGNYNTLTYAEPILKKYGFKATVSIVGKYTIDASESADEPNPAYSYLRWKDISKMRESGIFEFCNHTYDMHNYGVRHGSAQINTESYEDYRNKLIADVMRLQQLCSENCSFRPNVFTYPFGAECDSGRRLIKNMGFEASLGTEEKTNIIVKGKPETLFDLHRFNRQPYDSTVKNL